ncbi:MAG: uroporphyrinogen decarboxylase family protein [Proteocatella sp.]
MDLDFSCKFSEKGDISPKIMEILGLDFAKIYDDKNNIIRIASAIKAENNNKTMVLPFCHTVEAKAMGGDIRPGDDTAGPRPGSYVYSNLEEIKKISVMDNPDAKRLLQSCADLKHQGENVVFMITGPISILSSIMDLTVVFKAWRKNPDLLSEVFGVISEMLLEFVKEISAAGADIISFADPAGNPDILGGKYTASLAEMFLLPFLTKAIEVCGDSTTICLCPLAAATLSKMNLIKLETSGNGQLACSCVKKMPETIIKHFSLS